MTQQEIQQLLNPIEVEYNKKYIRLQQLTPQNFFNKEVLTQDEINRFQLYKENLLGNVAGLQFSISSLLSAKMKLALEECNASFNRIKK